MSDPRPSSRMSIGAVVAAAVGVLAVLLGLALIAGLTSGSDPQTAASKPRTASGGTAAEPCTDPPPAPAEPTQYGEIPDSGLAEGAVWTATVTTNCGDITMKLDGALAPQTVSSFLFLAEDGFYDDTTCHRLTTSGIFVLQCGDPTGTGGGGPGYGYGVENTPPSGVYPRGTLAMARTADPNSNGSQFFIVYQDSEIPDATGYSIFGSVTSGLGIVDRIAAQGVGGSVGPESPAQPISILSIAVEKTG